ncbi:MAG: hypothetical protein K2M08_00785 [Anaeroplasmataceae bacterium]|nr:hypothetical protein [Anaeroplasmataceae bacterium]MDE6240939.1 hypothetical protein [Anaeroplasmataceae bacterium]
MKRFFKWLAASVATLSLILLVACSNVSQRYADKINNAAKNGEPITLEQVQKDLGDDRVDILILGNGVIISVKGCKSVEDIKQKIDDGKDVEGIIVTIALSKATSAEYRKITTSDLK